MNLCSCIYNLRISTCGVIQFTADIKYFKQKIGGAPLSASNTDEEGLRYNSGTVAANCSLVSGEDMSAV